MAQGDVVFFDQWMVDVAEAKMDHELGAFFCALVSNTSPPVVATAVPHWNGTGTTNLQANEVAPATGNYTANGNTLANPSVALVGGNAEIDFDDPAAWLQNASNPTNAAWAVIYNNQAAKEGVGFIDLGGVFDMTTGDLTITLGAPCAYLDNT
jgi:hypothetical protein